MLVYRRVAKHIMTIHRKTRSLFLTLLSNTLHPIHEGVHASGLGTRDGAHQWARLSARRGDVFGQELLHLDYLQQVDV